MGKLTRISSKAAGKIQEIVGKMVIKDRIQRFYALAAHEKVALIKFKRDHGYCGGSPSCLEYTGPDVTLCRVCKHNASNPKSKRPTWEYGKIRSKEREQERADRIEKNAAERRPKRKAA